MKRKIINMAALAAICAILFSGCAERHEAPKPPPPPPGAPAPPPPSK
ncbi:MAG: hypothetical protein JST19_10605 [Bacteroidetes bacterium]|nr:hypothetical protein [Bacteroidota bacterium]